MPSRSKKNKSTLITVEQLVDIALGTPEIGAVNFNVLHALLHVIVQQLNIQRCLVEFKGHDSERMEGIIMTAKPGPILKVSEYVIDLSGGKPFNTDQVIPVPPQPSDRNAAGKKRPKTDTEDTPVGERKGRVCDCGQTDKEKIGGKSPKEIDETEKTDTAQEKYDKGKEELGNKEGIPMDEGFKIKEEPQEMEEDKVNVEMEENQQTAKDEEARKRGKKDKTGESGWESEKDMKKMSKKERCKEKKLAKRKKREEEEALLEAEARVKSDAEQSEKDKKAAECEDDKKKKTCPCNDASKDKSVCPESKMKESSSPYYSPENEASCQTIVRVETIGERCDTWRSRPALAHESLVKLEEQVTLLQDAFETLENMPTNEELMKRASGTGCLPTPVKDMWQLYNLNKRVESCEGAIEKLASMIEDLVKETCNFREAMMVLADTVDNIEGGAGGSENPCPSRVTPCCGATGGQAYRNSAAYSTSSFPPKQEVVAYPLIPPNPCGAFNKAASTASQVNVQSADEYSQTAINSPGYEEDSAHQHGLNSDFFKLSVMEKFCVLKESVECIMCQFKKFTDLVPLDQLAAKLCAIANMQKQQELLTQQWEEFLKSFSTAGVQGAVHYIKALRSDIEAINQKIAKIQEENRQTQLSIQALAREIEALKEIKADKETMEDLLAEKADAAMVNRKVSHDQFDAACDDLTKGLDDALERLIAQEALWNEAMDELQKDMENKLDKTEIMPLKEFISKKLVGLQEKLQQLAQLRKDSEAAGAKSRILRNLNCIACDNDVIMKMENKDMTQHPSLPPSRGIRPHITYELDQVRKALRKGPSSRGSGLGHAEEPAVVVEVQKKNIGIPLARECPETKVKKLEHYCNRYCGGSHTITTPQQRVTRIGHFLTEFGPQAIAMFNQDNQPGLSECKPADVGNSAIQRKDIRLE